MLFAKQLFHSSRKIRTRSDRSTPRFWNSCAVCFPRTGLFQSYSYRRGIKVPAYWNREVFKLSFLRTRSFRKENTIDTRLPFPWHLCPGPVHSGGNACVFSHCAGEQRRFSLYFITSIYYIGNKRGGGRRDTRRFVPKIQFYDGPQSGIKKEKERKKKKRNRRKSFSSWIS